MIIPMHRPDQYDLSSVHYGYFEDKDGKIVAFINEKFDMSFTPGQIDIAMNGSVASYSKNYVQAYSKSNNKPIQQYAYTHPENNFSRILILHAVRKFSYHPKDHDMGEDEMQNSDGKIWTNEDGTSFIKRIGHNFYLTTPSCELKIEDDSITIEKGNLTAKGKSKLVNTIYKSDGEDLKIKLKEITDKIIDLVVSGVCASPGSPVVYSVLVPANVKTEINTLINEVFE